MSELFNEVAHFRTRQESFEWGTPAPFVNAARLVMGGIDLDPASSNEANQTVKAIRYYTKEIDGLLQPWSGRVWLNPPYCKSGGTSNQEVWTGKLIAEYETGNVEQAILLVNASTETRWFQRLYAYPICFKLGKIHFLSPTGNKNGPTVGSAFVYLGPHVQKFVDVFDPAIGPVVRWVKPATSKQVDLWNQEEVTA